MLISDDNKEVVADIEKSIRVLRDTIGTLRLSRIIEKGFFVDSSKSLPLQLCDLFTLSYRKHIERAHCQMPAKTFDNTGIEISLRLTHADSKHDSSVIEWLTEQHQRKKEAARG